MDEIPQLTYEEMGGVYTAAATAAGIAASAEGIFIGANATAVLANNSTKTAIIPGRGITLGGDQLLEVVVFYKYTGAFLNPANIAWYQRLEPFAAQPLNLPQIVLQPGERLAIRVCNRAPAAACTITISVNFFQVEQRVYAQYHSKMRRAAESWAGV